MCIFSWCTKCNSKWLLQCDYDYAKTAERIKIRDLKINYGEMLLRLCFNRLATHFNISMLGHQAMFDGVWLPSISRLFRPLTVWPLTSISACLVAKHFLFVQALNRLATHFNISMFGRQIFPVCTGLSGYGLCKYLKNINDIWQSYVGSARIV